MNKKKLAALSLAVVLVVMAVAGASLAYLTDTKQATNTFTIGNVKIALIEQQRGENGLVDFEQNKKLLPIVDTEPGAVDEYGMPTARNYVDKMVTIKNTGSEAAYIRAYFAIPSALDGGYDAVNDGLDVLHFSFGKELLDGEAVETIGTQWSWKHGDKWNYFETELDGIQYNVYYADYYQAVAAGDTTAQLLQGVYLDESFEMREDGAYARGKKLTLDEGWDWSKVSCPVYAVACQAGGFDSASEAITAAFGASYNPFSGTAANWQ